MLSVKKALLKKGGLAGTPEATHPGSSPTCSMLRLALREKDAQIGYEVSGQYVG